ncbi:hypothetical protein [Brevundimonas sp. SL161]|uniref:hypothetical protein n=1 Tax=Brevundimonas sp. SL161 TaxID=2804613 RepID=UPI003CF0D067
MTPIETAANDHKSAGRYAHPFDTPELGYIVTIAGYDGLHEALEPIADGRWIFRALNTEGPALVYAYPHEMTVFDLPIYHCFASRDRSEIVALVSGPDFDVTDNDPEVAAPLFQKVHSAELIEFCEMALAAGFSTIDLTNGYMPLEVTIEELIDQCRVLAAGNPA